MKRCPSCGRAFSDMVKTCPTCGIDIEPDSQEQIVKATVTTENNAQSNTQQAANAEKKEVTKRVKPLYWIVYIVAAVIVGVLVSNLDAYGMGVVVGSIIMGAIVGLIPFLAAKSRGKAKLGKIAMVVTIVCNFLGGVVLSIPSAIVFTILALKK